MSLLKAIGFTAAVVSVAWLSAPWVAYAYREYERWCEKKMFEWKCRRRL